MQSLPVGSAFDVASRAVVEYLRETVPFGLWMVTRYESDRQIYLSLAGDGYPHQAGDSIAWSQTMCQYSVTAQAPTVAPDVSTVELYRNTPAGQEGSVGAYVGMPIHCADGKLFGTLCGLDASPQASLAQSTGLLTLLADLLGHILDVDLERSAAIRDTEFARALAESDALTGLLNRRGWDRMTAVAENRCRSFGEPCSLIIVDLDGLKAVNDARGHSAGDDLIRTAGDVLRRVVRQHDVVARLGGDEFGVIATLSATAAAALMQRLREAFAAAHVPASLGLAQVEIKTGIDAAWQAADENMYAAKVERRKTRRPTQRDHGRLVAVQ